MSVDGFNYDNILVRGLNRIGDVMILSIIFAVSCLPIFTIGTAITAMYYTTMKSLKIEDGYVFKFYIKSFKENFKQSTVIWLITFVALAVLSIDVWFWYNQWKANDNSAFKVMLIISVVMLLVAVMVTMYVFPLQAKFNNKTKIQFKNAFLLSIKYFPTTILLLAVLAVAVWTFYYQFVLAAVGFVLFGFGVMGYIYGFFMLKCFKPFLEVPKTDTEKIDTEESDTDVTLSEVKQENEEDDENEAEDENEEDETSSEE